MIKDLVEKKIQAVVSSMGIEKKVQCENPSNSNFGDYSTNIAMQLSKELKKNPIEIAEKIAGTIKNDQLIEKVTVVKPGFINIWISKNYLFTELQKILNEKNTFGSSKWGVNEKWIIEHTSPNPNKAMHLGHLRNNVTGMAIANIAEFIGVNVIRDCIDNNRGIAIAKLMWGYLKFAHKHNKQDADVHYWFTHQEEWKTPIDMKLSPDIFVDQLYVKGAEEFKKKEVEIKVRQLVVDWENSNQENLALWRTVLDYSYKGQQLTLKRLGNKWDKVWHEHEHYKMGKNIVEEGLQRKIFKKAENGTIITDLESYKIPDTVLIKSDGTSLYITQDLALTKLKKEIFHPTKLFWVIGSEQSLALKQVFAICEQLGIGTLSDFMHIDYGYMSLKGKGKMSSRQGNVIYIDTLLDEAKVAIQSKMDKSKFSLDEMERISEKIAVGAVKYSILKSGRTTDTAFDFETSLTFDGDAGPYLQYTYARCKKLGTKSSFKLSSEHTLNEDELDLTRTLSKFPESVQSAATQYAPNHIAHYLFNVAQKYNFFYQKNTILKADEKTKNFRLALTEATAQVIQNGLALLGIETVERM